MKFTDYISTPFWYIQRKYTDIRCWFRLCFNKNHFKVIKEAICGYPFDYCYMWSLQRSKLKEMLEYFKKSNITEDNWRIVRDLNLAINFLDIMINEDELYEYTPGKNWPGNYKCLINVNLTNIDRFVKNKDDKDFIINKMQHNLYVLKVKNLYYKLLQERSEAWWD